MIILEQNNARACRFVHQSNEFSLMNWKLYDSLQRSISSGILQSMLLPIRHGGVQFPRNIRYIVVTRQQQEHLSSE